MTRSISALAICAALVGCATGPTFNTPEPAPADQAQLYIYRPFAISGGALLKKVMIDGKAETLSLPNMSWKRVLVAPGMHTVSITDPFNLTQCGGVRVNLEPGQTAYIANLIKTYVASRTIYISCVTNVIPREQALKDMAGLSGAQ